MNAMDRTAFVAAASELPGNTGAFALKAIGQLSDDQLAHFPDSEDLTSCVALMASSDYAAHQLIREWDWFCGWLDAGNGCLPDTVDALPDDEQAAKLHLRTFRHRCLLGVLWWSRTGRHPVWETIAALSKVADCLISAAIAHAINRYRRRFGLPHDANGKASELIVMAMGKLGGHELNFSSDVDLVFLYTADGVCDGRKSLSASEFFTRVVRFVVRLLDDVTDAGFVYRVDTRLRPFGESGPPVMSIAAFENYLLQHGRNWERYAWIKARAIGAASPESAVEELQRETIEPFVYRRYLDYGVFESLREMKALIETEVERREMSQNIKLGPGGIREIEFVVQSLQLVRAGADKRLRVGNLRTALTVLRDSRAIDRTDAEILMSAYAFLRSFENNLQALRDQQSHDIPDDPADQERLALALGFPDWSAVSGALAKHRDAVAEIFARTAFRSADESANAPAGTAVALWNAGADTGAWRRWLEEESFREAGEIAEAVTGFASSAALRQIDAVASERIGRFMDALLISLKALGKPGETCTRVLAIVSRIARRSAYVALLNENPAILQRLLDLCEQSAYLAGELARYPQLLDDLADPSRQPETLNSALFKKDLRERLARSGDPDEETRIEVLTRFQRSNLFRVAVADVGGQLPVMKVSDSLTELAEVVLEEALTAAWQDMCSRYGEPCYQVNDENRKAGFCVIAYGKLAGIELSYGSDLDLVFLHDSTGQRQETNGETKLQNSVYFGRLVRRLVHYLTTQTASGALYDVDTRLRPSGESGLLVSSVEGFAAYQLENAWTWEHQALLRSRPVAGSATIARRFDDIRLQILREKVRHERLLEDVTDMRQRMRGQLDKSNTEQFDLKQGAGGIGDIEFIVQYLVLAHSSQHPELLFYPDNIRQLGALDATGVLQSSDVIELQQIYRRYRHDAHRLALDGQPAMVAADAFWDERAAVCSVWEQTMREPATLL